MTVKAYEYFLRKGVVYDNLRVRSDWPELIQKLMERATYFNTLGVMIPDPSYEGRRKFIHDSARLDCGQNSNIDPIEDQ